MLGTTNIDDQKQLDALDELLKKKPHDIKVLMQKAFILYYCFRDHEAIAVYKKVIELDPNFVNAYFWMAECMRDHLANFDEAIAAIMREKGIRCARRTIAKYRVLMKIATAQQRRKF